MKKNKPPKLSPEGESLRALLKKILAAPHVRREALRKLSELVEETDDPELKEFYSSYRDIITESIEKEARA
jgi:uncharacterized protein YbgA (DUF1722 family)